MSEFVHVSAIASQIGMPLSRIMAFHADRDPDALCLSVGDRSIARRSFDELSNGLALTYQRLGVAPGDLVTIALPNSIELCLAIFAAWKCGAVPHMMSYRMPPHEAQDLVDLVDPPDGRRYRRGHAAQGRAGRGPCLAALEGDQLGGQHRPAQGDRRAQGRQFRPDGAGDGPEHRRHRADPRAALQ